MGKVYIFADGDNIGSMAGQKVLQNDLEGFIAQSKRIRDGNNLISQWIENSAGKVFNNEGDEIVGEIDESFIDQIEDLRAKYLQLTNNTISIGLGDSLSQAGKALIVAKITGKDRVVRYDHSVEDIINRTHQEVHDGSADEEQKKMDEHYIEATMSYEQNHENQDMSSEHPKAHETSLEDMIQKPEDFISEDHMPYEEMLEEEQEEDDKEQQQEKPSEFEQEPSIALEGEEALDENLEDQNTEKVDPEMATEEDSLDADLADTDGNEEILQRIAANLDAFKQNKDLMDQIKETKPELYAAILGLLYNMIELAKMISPEGVSSEEEEKEVIYVPSGNDSEHHKGKEQEILPKQKG